MNYIEVIEYLKEPFGKSLETHRESVELAVMALEKQLPEKPIESEFDPLICPDCEAKVTLGQKYCINCGQRLDWRDEE